LPLKIRLFPVRETYPCYEASVIKVHLPYTHGSLGIIQRQPRFRRAV